MTISAKDNRFGSTKLSVFFKFKIVNHESPFNRILLFYHAICVKIFINTPR